MQTRLPQTIRCRSMAEYEAWQAYSAVRDAEIATFETALTEARPKPFTIPGECAVCEKAVEFQMDYNHSWTRHDGVQMPNWRERMICPHCALNNRQRAAVSFLLSLSSPQSHIYLTEQLTTPAKAVAAKRANFIGSEYLRDGTACGACNQDGVRHEDATCLTFDDDTFDLIGSFDVLEHVPAYDVALREMYRCLAPGGTLIVTAPFNLTSAANIVRAIITPSGEVEHLLPPEIHGDPIDEDGALCFYHFGWEMVGELTQMGFADAGLRFFWSSRLGYLGGNQCVIMARKPRATRKATA